jgi:pSer/pThr/pTyr-binding forkhead associated (FHA) protein
VNRKEAFEFLELPDSASDNDIRVRLDDKLNYFNLLSENAPNEFLRKLHLKNTEKVRDIQNILLQTTQPASPSPSFKPPVSQNNSFSDNSANNYRSADNNERRPVGWLVRHTENQPSKTFALYFGKNFIGRQPNLGGAEIIIDDDPFLSRMHALLEVTSTDPLQIVVSDDDSSNHGKASKNGTFVNGNTKRINRAERLRENDTIQVGMTKLIIREANNNIRKIVDEVENSDYMKTVVINLF